METLEEYKAVSSKAIAEALVNRYAREIDKLKNKPKLSASDLPRLRELREAAEAHRRLMSK